MRHKINWKRIGWIAGIAFLVYFIIGIILAGRDMAPLPSPRHDIELSIGHVRVHDRLTRRSWSLDYDKAVFSPDYTSGTVDGVHNGILFRKGKPYLRITAEHVSVNLQSLDFVAIGKVHIERINDKDKQKNWYDTDLVSWSNGTKLLHMDHPAYLHTDSQTLRFDNVTLDFTTKTAHFGKINGSVEVRK